jgi:hypothetical protein
MIGELLLYGALPLVIYLIIRDIVFKKPNSHSKFVIVKQSKKESMSARDIVYSRKKSH